MKVKVYYGTDESFKGLASEFNKSNGEGLRLVTSFESAKERAANHDGHPMVYCYYIEVGDSSEIKQVERRGAKEYVDVAKLLSDARLPVVKIPLIEAEEETMFKSMIVDRLNAGASEDELLKYGKELYESCVDENEYPYEYEYIVRNSDILSGAILVDTTELD